MYGNYIELGAHNGYHLSNTKMFEDHFNWTGILIEPHPLNFEKLKINKFIEFWSNISLKIHSKNMQNMHQLIDLQYK